MNILQTIGAGIVSIGLFFGGLFGYTPADAPVYTPDEEALGADTVLPAGIQTYTLAGTGISSSATSFTLTSLTLPQNGYAIQDSDMSDTFYVTFEPGSRQRQEFVSCTTVGANSGGSVTISGCTRGLSPLTPYTASTSLRFAHSGGTSVIFSDAPQFYNQYTAKENDETITGIWSFPNPTTASGTVSKGYLEANALIITSDQSFAGAKTFTGTTTMSTTTINSGTIAKTPVSGTDITNKTYVDGVAIAGASNADETTKGIVEEGTQAEVNAFTATGGTGASLYVAPDKLLGGVSSTMMFYNATSTTDANLSGISMTANDIVMMWAQFDSSSCVSGSANFVTGSLIYKQSNLAASTTVSTVSDAHAAAGSCNAVAIGMVTATTTMTLNVSADISSGSYSSVIAQLFIR